MDQYLPAFLFCVAVAASTLHCSSEGHSQGVPACDCSSGTVCNVVGDCVRCLNVSDSCADKGDCAGKNSCLSMAGTCSCVSDDTYLSDPLGDHFAGGDPSDSVNDGNPALDIDTTLLSCDAGLLRAAMRFADPVLNTSDHFVSYSLLITSGNDGAPQGGLLGEGLVQLSLETSGGTTSSALTCKNIRYSNGEWNSVPVPDGARCTVEGRVLLLEYPVLAENVAGSDTGLRLFSYESRDRDNDGIDDILIDLADETNAYPALCR